MALQEKLKRPEAQIQTGLIFLGLASLSKWFLQPGDALSDQWTDGVTGLLYGLAIGFMLLGVWRKSRRGKSDI
jgi:peptidoglycan/LPS O-acetylase OafA/YrhL